MINLQQLALQGVTKLRNTAPAQLPELFTTLFVCLMVSLFPLLAPGGFGNTSSGKFYVWLSLCGIYALGLAWAAWRGRGAASRTPWRVRWAQAWSAWGSTEKFLLLLALLLVVAALFSPFGKQTILGQGRYDGLLTKLLLIASALTIARWGRWQAALLELMAGVTLVMCAIAALQLLGHDPFGLYPTGTLYVDGGVRYTGRFLSTVGNVDMLSGYFCLAIPLTAYGAVFRPGWRRALHLLALVGALIIMRLMQVSGGWVGLAGAAAIIAPLYAPRGKRRWLVLLVLILLLAMLGWLYFGVHQEGSLTDEASRMLHGEVRDEFGSSRVLIWKEAWQSMPGNWLIGTGPGTKRSHFSTVFSREVEGRVLKARVSSGHSEYLDLLMEGGLLCLAAYLAALVCLAARCYQRWQQPGVAALTGAVAAYLAQACFIYSSIVLAPQFWALLGLLLACSRKSDGEEKPCTA